MKLLVYKAMSACVLLVLVTGCGRSLPQAEPVNLQLTPGTAPTALPAQPALGTPVTAQTGNPQVIKFVFSHALDDKPDVMQLRLKQANFSACDGKYSIQYEVWDNTSPATGLWDSQQERENAQRAIADPDVMIYFGPTSSGAAKVSIPILNRANMLMISPLASLPGLTKQNAGDPGEPEVYYPTGTRNFTRSIPSDDTQGIAGAIWANNLKLQSVYVLNDGDIYGKTIARIFETKAKSLGLTVVGSEQYNKSATEYDQLVERVIATQPRLVYISGLPYNATLIRGLREGGYTGQLMGPDSLYNAELLAELGPLAEGLYATFATVPVQRAYGKASELYIAYTTAYEQEPESTMPFYYDAMSIALAGLESVCVKDRAAIRDALFDLKRFQGVLGTWRFDANGDTTLTTMSGMQVQNGAFDVAILISASQ